MNQVTDIKTKATPDEQQSKWIQREVERLMVSQRYEDGYKLYLTDPTLDAAEMDYDTFVETHR